jgi:ion channel
VCNQERLPVWRELLVALLLIACNVVIHGLGSYALIRWVQDPRSLGATHAVGRAVWMIFRIFVVLPTLHFLEAAVWAEFYFMQHCFADRETAYYFSLQSYSTVGYGDVVISHPWRLMGGLEAIGGVLLFGWSTAILVGFITRFREAREANQPRFSDSA